MFERTDFFWPRAVHDDRQRAPAPNGPPVAGPTPFDAYADAGAIGLWAEAFGSGGADIGPGSADQFLALRLERGLVSLGVQSGDGRPAMPGPKGRWPRYYPSQPWFEMPPDGIPFYNTDSIATPVNNGVETLVLSVPVPEGVDGVIRRILNRYTGPGFTEGKGDLIWRIRQGAALLNGMPVRNHQRITTSSGSTEEFAVVEGGIRVYSGQQMEFSVTHSTTSGLPAPGTRIVCGFKGYFWPRVHRM